jgi:uncharacterized protein YcbX
MASVDTLYRYPVKSMQGESVESLEFVSGPAEGDRRWAIAEKSTGGFLSAKRHGQLLEARARTGPAGSVIIALPGRGDDGLEVEAGDPAADEALSAWLGREVELCKPGGDRAPSYEGLADPLDESSETQSFAGPVNHFADFAECHLLTNASLRAARGLRPEGDWDARRFRPTALLEAGDEEGYVEDGWVGALVTLGESASFVVFMQTIRCNLPTRAQPGLGRDTSVARLLRDHHDFCLGVYGAFRSPGRVCLGDQVTIARL